MLPVKKRKVDSEIRTFEGCWTEQSGPALAKLAPRARSNLRAPLRTEHSCHDLPKKIDSSL